MYDEHFFFCVCIFSLYNIHDLLCLDEETGCKKRTPCFLPTVVPFFIHVSYVTHRVASSLNIPTAVSPFWVSIRHKLLYYNLAVISFSLAKTFTRTVYLSRSTRKLSKANWQRIQRVMTLTCVFHNSIR